MVPSKLLRHIETNHREQMNNPIRYFENIRSSFQKQSKKFKKYMTTSDEAQTASYMRAQLIARKKKAHAEAEEIILPALKIVAGCMLTNDAMEKVTKIPLSSKTIARRIEDMSEDIELQIKQSFNDSSTKWAIQLDETTDISNKAQLLAFLRTISRRLVANGLNSCRPLRRLPLTPPNRRQRLEWCRARSTWMTEWHRVVFSDESRFCLSSDSRRVRVWRQRGERSNPAAIVQRPTVRQRGIMVWGAIAYDSRSPLLRIQGTMTAQRYVDDVLRPVTLPYLQGVPNALYQQDNARPHTARISQQALQDVQMLPWPPYSPDLSPIEHVWDIIGRRLHALPQPRSEDELWKMVEREWRAIPQDAIRTLIDSLPRRVAACIAVRGGPTCY
ncbi:Transposase [Cordylochernes scorpioides]|uniref:Transposase n=1 Tax=Cordylochernes scorpioides TaxID=51811 RepID=A0ABY6L7I8_9ARAC|nr:Transposase [Cordylochernes scorpioides]